MVFRDRSYSLLLVCGSEKFNTQVQNLLPFNEYYPVRNLKSISEARRELLERSYDIVLINWAESNEAKSFACDVSERGKSAVLLMTDKDCYDDMYFDVISFGVACIPRQMSAQEFTRALRIVCSGIERVLGERKKQTTVEDKMAEIRLVNKAKWALIEAKGMSEDDAHKYIEHLAMNERITRKEAAEKILKIN